MARHNALPISSLRVEGFRALRSLCLPELGRVNLFVGKNNAGKTSLLEAITLYLQRNSKLLPSLILEIIQQHADFRPRVFGRRPSDLESRELESAAEAIETLFYGSFSTRTPGEIFIGDGSVTEESLVLRLPWTNPLPLTDDSSDGASERAIFLAPDSPLLEMVTETGTSTIPVEWFLRRMPLLRRGRRTAALIIPASGLEPFRVREMWDRVTVAGHEELVEDALRTIVPELERVLLVGESGRRAILVRVKGLARPIPLQSMGDGVNRVFGIATAMVRATNGALLIDEIENGLHYSVQDEVWRAIFFISRALDVQVFASSHSWDSIVGFQYAANTSEEEGLLYRLERRQDDRVDAIRFSETEVEIAAEQGIEIR